MSTSNVHQEPESIQLTPLFSTSQQSQSLLLPTLETDADTLSPCGEGSSSDQLNQHDPIDRKETDSAFLIRQASTICDLGEPSAPRKEVPAYMQWSLEILVLLFAGAIFMSICFILNHYHGNVLPGWEDLLITLNTLISVLATILRVAIAFVTFEVIAQLKWEWLATCFRPVYHAQLFNAASRGVYGSIRLLPTIFRQDPFAVAAIAIAVLSLGIGSFTQQSIQTNQCLRKAPYDNDLPFIKIANTVDEYDMTDQWVLGGKTARRMNLKMQVTIQDAIVNGVKDYHLATLFKCSSGNCYFKKDFSFTQDDEEMWYSHASVGICNSCADIHELVVGPKSENRGGPHNLTSFELPFEITKKWKGHGHRGKAKITGKDGGTARVMTTTTVDEFLWARKAVTAEFLDLAQMSVVNFTILTASQYGCKPSDGGNSSCPYDCKNRKESQLRDGEACIPSYEESFNPIAAACTLYPCLKYYIADVTDARLQEQVVQEVPLQLYGRGSLWDKYNEWMVGGNVSLAAVKQPCLVKGVSYTDESIPLDSHFDNDDVVSDIADSLNSTAPLECVFEMPQGVWISLWNELSLGLNSNCSSMDEGGVQCKVRRTKDEVGHSNQGIPSYPAHMAALYHSGNASVKTITETFDSLATRMTTAIRLDGKRLGRDEKAKVEGDLLETKICVKFVWKWLIFPGALLAASTALLVAMVIKDTVTKKTSIWKSSILPLLLKDHPETQSTSLNGLEEVAQGLEIRLQRRNSQRDLTQRID